MIKKVKILFIFFCIFFSFNPYLKAENTLNSVIIQPTISLQAFLSKYPLLNSFGAIGLVGYILYPNRCKWFVEEYKNPIFGLSSLAIMGNYCMQRYYSDIDTHQEEELNNDVQHNNDVQDDDTPEDDDSQNSEKVSELEKLTDSGVRIYFPGKIQETFKDVAGLETAKDDLRDIKMFLENPRKFKAIGAKVPKGVLMSGAPGNGKTLLARALAGEVKCPFLYVAATEFSEVFVGVGAARIRDLFEKAREHAPCIIFIDEIDTVGHKRSSFATSNSDAQTLNQLLAEMDGFEQNDTPIVVIGATNRVDIIDEALLRPGRFDRKIEILAPFFKDRCALLSLALKKVKTASHIDVEKVAMATMGFSGAELANMVNEAAILAVRLNSNIVTMEHLDQARDYVLLGRETKGMDIVSQEAWVTAVHEAGHALMHVYQKEASALYKVTITPRGGALGLTFGMPIKEKYSRTDTEMKAEISVCLGGSVAEEIVFGHRGAGASNDLEKVRYVATHMVMSYGMTEGFKDVSFKEFIYNQNHLPDQIATKLHEAVAKIIAECRKETEDLLLEHKDMLLDLAKVLMDKGTVLGSDVYKMCGIQEPDLVYSLV